MPKLKLAENPARDSRGLGLRAHGLGLAARIAGLESRAWDYSGWISGLAGSWIPALWAGSRA
ncbi:hypothetical protein TIFTF001_026856 [Ficus carica]|uniref:Uncharacterized protein n=1 Tax=Ficus carica TaxID=3494 RepID=A0AA88IZ93_FICCA|nr:hypothetical protein TIFTF001_026856 [Ficus carica]